ncbi:myosin light chain 5-like isoform X3 [Xiphias gladius]|uniref:myosin light chain 5-like isoform X3 n=1 Tax=Xiphias gladius TaxID=8245 RepID=UPI001A994CEE|nr:myosin light chain 5-like isoform X3 [Xiphias gladius]
MVFVSTAFVRSHVATVASPPRARHHLLQPKLLLHNADDEVPNHSTVISSFVFFFTRDGNGRLKSYGPASRVLRDISAETRRSELFSTSAAVFKLSAPGSLDTPCRTSIAEGKEMASRKTKKKEGGAKRAQRASSNVFSMFEQTQIQEFKEAFTLIDQNRDGFIDKEDLKDTYASLGKLNVKDNELDAMLKEAAGPINFTMFLNLFGEKLHGTDPEDTILNAFRMFDPDAKGFIQKDELQKLLMTQADRFTSEEVKQMFQSSNIDAEGNLDYKSLCYIITHGEEQEE